MKEATMGTADNQRTKQRIMPDVWWCVALVGSIGLHYVSPIAQLWSFPANLAGILLIVGGGAMAIVGDRQFKRHETTIKTFGEPSKLIMTGMYRYSRNPIYVGMIGSLLGVSVLLGSVSAFVLPIALLVSLDRYFIPFEECKLARIFGESYRAYRQSVRRWV